MNNLHELSDNESQFEWSILLCIKLVSQDDGIEKGGYVTINLETHSVDYKTYDKVFGPCFGEGTFHKMKTGIKSGTLWTKMFDWELEDYENVLNSELIMNRLENNITPNPTFIDEMISNLRGLKINKLIENDTNT